MTTIDGGLLILRLGVGAVFAIHGAQKVFGWWNGPGIAGWHGAMEGMGFRPARFFAWLSALAELIGGLMIVVGLLTPIVAAILLAQSVVIIGAVHLPNGFFNKGNGYEFPLVLAAGVVAILLVGPGGSSFDEVIRFGATPQVAALLCLLGLLAGLAVLALRPAMANTTATASPPGSASRPSR